MTAYQTLHEIAAFDAVLATPGDSWLLKHSNACPTSAAALAQFTQYLAEHPGQRAALVVVQEARPLSNHIASVLQYVHQSPQLFLLRDGQVAWTASHWGITTAAMAAAQGT